jgi:uncharacterized protein YecE (DUF72 family)
MFSAKLNQKFTHDLRFGLDKKSQDELMEFLQLFDPLLAEDRLGCFLIQLPPSLKRSMSLLERFLATLLKRYEFVVDILHVWMPRGLLYPRGAHAFK